MSQMARLEAMIAAQSELIARQAATFAAQQANVVSVASRVVDPGTRQESQIVVGPTMENVGPTTTVGGMGPTGVPSGQGDQRTGDETEEFVTGLLTLRSPPAGGGKNKSS